MKGEIPIIETYRGVGIHADQPSGRIERTVKPAIDEVSAMTDADQLFDYCGKVSNPPEARLLAAARCEAIFEIAVQERRARPQIDVSLIHANVAGLNSLYWRNPWSYGSLLDVTVGPGSQRAVPREQPLEDRYWDR